LLFRADPLSLTITATLTTEGKDRMIRKSVGICAGLCLLMAGFFALPNLGAQESATKLNPPQKPFVAAAMGDWQLLKGVSVGQLIRVSIRGGGPHEGTLQDVSDDAIAISNGQTFRREEVLRVWMKGHGSRLKHALIGAGIGAGAGLGVGAGIANATKGDFIALKDSDTLPICAAAFGMVGMGIGAALPSHGWKEVYRSK
jgi:hypothetical protein